MGPAERAAFWIGAVVADDVEHLVRHPILGPPATGLGRGTRAAPRALYARRLARSPLRDRSAAGRRPGRGGVGRRGPRSRRPTDAAWSGLRPAQPPLNRLHDQTTWPMISGVRVSSSSTGTSGIVSALLVGPEDHVPAADLEPADHGDRLGAGGDDPALERSGSVIERSMATIEPAGRIGCMASSSSRTPTVCARVRRATGGRP